MTEMYIIVLKRGLEPPPRGRLKRSGPSYDFRPWPPKGPRRPLVEHPDNWRVYVAIGSNVIIPRAGLWQRFRAEGWTYERFCAALDRLRDLGVIDVVTSIQKHRPTYDRLEIPLKD